jgi:hypothetical protein
MNQNCQSREESNDTCPATVENRDGFPKSGGRRLMPQLWRSGLFLIHQHKLRPGAHRLSNYAFAREAVSRLLGAIFHRHEVLSLQLLTGAYPPQSGQTVADIISSGLLLVAFVGSYLRKIALSKLEQKTFAGLFWCWYFSLA